MSGMYAETAKWHYNSADWWLTVTVMEAWPVANVIIIQSRFKTWTCHLPSTLPINHPVLCLPCLIHYHSANDLRMAEIPSSHAWAGSAIGSWGDICKWAKGNWVALCKWLRVVFHRSHTLCVVCELGNLSSHVYDEALGEIDDSPLYVSVVCCVTGWEQQVLSCPVWPGDRYCTEYYRNKHLRSRDTVFLAEWLDNIWVGRSTIMSHSNDLQMKNYQSRLHKLQCS